MSNPTEAEPQKMAQQTQPAEGGANKSLSMHADIPVWYDCCSCEAEPYWLEAMAAPTKDPEQ